eukprot:1160008-Pelagomonas_calceolata.AAC.4
MSGTCHLAQDMLITAGHWQFRDALQPPLHMLQRCISALTCSIAAPAHPPAAFVAPAQSPVALLYLNTHLQHRCICASTSSIAAPKNSPAAVPGGSPEQPLANALKGAAAQGHHGWNRRPASNMERHKEGCYQWTQ